MPKAKREEDATFFFEYVQYTTQTATNYKGFERSIPVSENQVRENHENQHQNRCFLVGAIFSTRIFSSVVLEGKKTSSIILDGGNIPGPNTPKTGRKPT